MVGNSPLNSEYTDLGAEEPEEEKVGPEGPEGPVGPEEEDEDDPEDDDSPPFTGPRLDFWSLRFDMSFAACLLACC